MANATITTVTKIDDQTFVQAIRFEGADREIQQVAEGYAKGTGVEYVAVDMESDNPHLRKDVVYLRLNDRGEVLPYFGASGLKRVEKMIEAGN